MFNNAFQYLSSGIRQNSRPKHSETRGLAERVSGEPLAVRPRAPGRLSVAAHDITEGELRERSNGFLAKSTTCFVLAFVFGMASVSAADDHRSLTLIDAENQNGSFEANAKSPLPWRITRRFKVTEPELALVTGADSASHGDQHVTLAATNELHERGSVGIGIQVRGPQLDGFREFVAEPDSRWILRLTWVAKTRKPLGFSFATGLITLQHARDSGQPDQHFRLREAVSDGDWQTFSVEGHFTSKR